MRAGIVGYLLGTIPSADLVARRVSGGQVDLRASGSGNPGGANALKLLGTRAGLTVMVADIAKGAAASTFGRLVAGAVGAQVGGTASVVGHCFPIWNRFRGGKGVAASVGQCLATFPAYFPIDVGVALTTVAVPRWKHRAFAATTVASATWVVGGLVWWRRRLPNLWGPTPSASLPLGALASSAVILYRFATAAGPSSGGDPGTTPTGGTGALS